MIRFMLARAVRIGCMQPRRALSAHFGCQVNHVAGYHIEITRFGGVGLTSRTVLVWPVNEPSPQTETSGSSEVGAMCRSHHDLFRLEAEQFNRGQICLAIRLIVLGYFGAQDQVPRQTCVFSHIREERHVPVGTWCDSELLFE